MAHNPLKTLELYYPMIQFLIMDVIIRLQYANYRLYTWGIRWGRHGKREVCCLRTQNNNPDKR